MDTVIKGVLTVIDGMDCVVDAGGNRHFESEKIWDGYRKHWTGTRVCARRLQQCDYDTGAPIIIMWPDEPPEPEPFVELYYNERLVKYPASVCGHVAINVNGRIFNYSHLLNENEVITPKEYFYRPALGEFAPSPTSGKFEITAAGKAYYDKFGRNFMRTIHVVRVLGLDTARLAEIYQSELRRIHATPVNPRRPEKYRDFNFFTRSCTTIIRDGLRRLGFPNIRGVMPRDFFVSAAAELLEARQRQPLRLHLYRKPQLLVPEAPPSALTMLTNIHNRRRYRNFPPETTSK